MILVQEHGALRLGANHGGRVVRTGSDVVRIHGNRPGLAEAGDDWWVELAIVFKVERRLNAVAMMGTGAGLRPVPLSWLA